MWVLYLIPTHLEYSAPPLSFSSVFWAELSTTYLSARSGAKGSLCFGSRPRSQKRLSALDRGRDQKDLSAAARGLDRKRDSRQRREAEIKRVSRQRHKKKRISRLGIEAEIEVGSKEQSEAEDDHRRSRSRPPRADRADRGRGGADRGRGGADRGRDGHRWSPVSRY